MLFTLSNQKKSKWYIPTGIPRVIRYLLPVTPIPKSKSVILVSFARYLTSNKNVLNVMESERSRVCTLMYVNTTIDAYDRMSEMEEVALGWQIEREA